VSVTSHQELEKLNIYRGNLGWIFCGFGVDFCGFGVDFCGFGARAFVF
jgi:hypothetical protein